MPTHKILVVDDETFVRDLLEEFLSKQGYDVSLAESGEKAVDIAGQSDFDVGLVDLKMPGIDGLETLNRLKDIHPHMPIIVMTGYPTIETSIKALRLGAYDYVVKPFKLNELKVAVEKALKERRLKVEIDLLRNKIKTIEGELHKYETDSKAPPPQIDDTEYPSESEGRDRIIPTNQNAILEQLRKLGELRELGVLSDEEFAEKKSDLLAKL